MVAEELYILKIMDKFILQKRSKHAFLYKK